MRAGKARVPVLLSGLVTDALHPHMASLAPIPARITAKMTVRRPMEAEG